MENMTETPSESPVESEVNGTECKTPQLNQQADENDQNSGNDLRKPVTPDRLRVPKSFRYPERYTSPTDLMMSPVTKGLLARSRKAGALIPPGRNQTEIPQLRVENAGDLFQN